MKELILYILLGTSVLLNIILFILWKKTSHTLSNMYDWNSKISRKQE